ncbi:hypothetical protein PTIM40_5 [Cyanophage P-TIM40]|uniref:Uncharacterized protein n=1 Tax=Cyanophage P-TIM40 TaxID=1589733 RepID=A0A0C5ADS5_9CAUD|nr:hypothetical protein AU107_gp005 [Cyanophage P-TIM40]AJK27432.1 hypothetical protein PTIM40_5 [Cyanophage P-TIM40]|tara:strand:+ start:75 stop:227 length:153 start_codon:yes stop_codon:yes gene_type:complete
MPNPDQLWEDMKRLNDVMEELMWDPDDEIIFSHNGKDIIIKNRTQSLDKG